MTTCTNEENDMKWDFISLHIRSMWETTVMHKQVSGWTVNFGPNFPESPFLELKTRKPPPPHFGKLQIWDDQSLLRNTPLPPFRKTSDLGWPKFTGIPPHFGKLQIWDKKCLLRNIPPPISENFRFGMTKVYSGIPLPNENCQRVQVREFQNTESYYMWRLYPTRITTSFLKLKPWRKWSEKAFKSVRRCTERMILTERTVEWSCH